jgi:nitrite reductase (NADH) large subunit
VYRTKPGKYAKAVVERGRLIGAIRVGDFAEAGRLQEAVARARRVMPWQAWRFSRQGSLWPEANLGGVADWPDGVTVCSCTGVTRGALGRALASGCATPQALAAATGASTVCGSCRPLLAELAGVTLEKAPEKGGRPLAVAGVGSIVLLSVLVLLSVPYAPSVQVPWSWDVLWRESFWKQASGYAVLGLTVLALLLSLRKRIRKLALGEFAHWRVVHAVVAALTLAGLAVHTGGRLGANLNLVLMLAFLAVVALGAGAGGVVAMEHRLGSRGARLRRAWTWVHLLAFWPVPVLLGMHVLKSYYF